MEKPLVNKTFLMQKMPGKGGWTFVLFPVTMQANNKPFRWGRVSGMIDNYEIKNYFLMPIKGGGLFMPIKAAIRKKIKKEAGDRVKIVLYADSGPLEIPADLLQCLRDEPAAHKTFMQFKESDQKAYIDWIEAAKKEETKTARIVQTIDRLLRGLKFADKKDV